MSENTESKYVTLVSSDGFSFVVLREAALVSGTLRGMLSGSKYKTNFMFGPDPIEEDPPILTHF